MTIVLPTQADANVGSQNAINAEITAAQAVFMASTTVLINNAINNGFFQVQPYLIPFVSSTFVTTTFQALGYEVLFPIYPFYGYPGYHPCFAPAGFPEVLGNDWVNWSCTCGNSCTAPRIQISWGPPVIPVESFLLLMDGNVLELMNGPGGLLLE